MSFSDQIDASEQYESLSESGSQRFAHDLQEMLFGFGDQWPPCRESVQLMESLV